jgi:hypothetical protein
MAKSILVEIDDSGWGNPLLGVAIGIHCKEKNVMDMAIVPVKFFQPPLFDRKEYLKEYARAGIELLEKHGLTGRDYEYNICRGYVNLELKNGLIKSGYKVTECKIEGKLQYWLETAYKSYVKTMTGVNLYYDPKGMNKKDIGQYYYRAVEWGVKNNKKMLKTGWKALRKYA